MNIALVLSGGTGTRIGGDIPKQYIKVKDRMLIAFCLGMFAEHKRIDGVWIVADPAWRDNIMDECGKQKIDPDQIKGFSIPGETRQLSILNGLRDISTYVSSSDEGNIADTVVIIHDAARPNLTAEYIDKCLDALEGYDGVMPVLPMKDTVYYSESGKSVDRLLDRSCIYAGQAPEVYRLDKYLEANERLLPDEIYKINGSTETAVLAGLNVAMIPGDENNYKITTQKDLERFVHDIG
ncbi:MAG: 2-C-methyl-D-erythritol 4-phosphate cytidylyltransferase [Lachnospiraceae bacterium]|nr:2-C-methyl-D-erythritol 4-phosphate cytidylyltransferase [Lachnospiraceae bacterium]